jgi:hypothetical protein
MAKPAKNFKTVGDYRAWLKYGHASGEFDESPGDTPVRIKGRDIKVQHKPPSKKSGK